MGIADKLRIMVSFGRSWAFAFSCAKPGNSPSVGSERRLLCGDSAGWKALGSQRTRKEAF